ncbi:MAG: GNAT family N-acetyltransferase [Ignavibacteriales bacterium]|nr:GNAT family N-acetyltransferase [Ignavibacteriales bacterium]
MPPATIHKVTTEEEFEHLFILIIALADFEKLSPPDESAKQRLFHDCFCEKPRFEAYLAFTGEQPVAYAIIFETYSSFLAKPTLYLEDIFVLPEYRKQKIGVTLFRYLVQLAQQRGCGRMEWQVLDWNTGAIDFYKRLGATHLKEWYSFRLNEEQIKLFPSL